MSAERKVELAMEQTKTMNALQWLVLLIIKVVLK